MVKVIDCDCNGMKLEQGTLDYIGNEIALAAAEHHDTVDIHIRRLNVTPPNARVIVDYGEIYEALRILLANRCDCSCHTMGQCLECCSGGRINE